ncbi:FMN-dependent NADH-azoreductase [Desulfobaculum sp. SPO524]|uniref:FMN-dependent NADH-azoreductase n=1 Tax=Desulfobaculum sp. SPO524 TaxID=3378071 RepID=UPI0038536D08
MSSLLYIKASPRGERSHSLAVAEAFVEAYRDAHPGVSITEKNLFTDDMPPFDGPTIQAKYNVLHGRDHTLAEKAAWDAVVRIIDEFRGHDRYLFAVPMWNFAIPYPLKHYIDLLVQPGLTFGMTEEGGYYGMLEGKKAAIMYARGGQYAPGTQAEAFNHQSPYLEMILGFMGITDVHPVAVEGTLFGPDVRDPARKAAMEQARTLAATL